MPLRPIYIIGLLGLLVPVLACAKQIWAKSYLGKQAPELVVEKWLTPAPKTAGKFVLIDYWATWCPPCRASIPELNALQEKFRSQLVVIGISDEDETTVRAMKSPRIDYAVAIDRKKRMKTQLAVTGIPHVILIDPSGIVRWEGFPLLASDRLTESTVANVISNYQAK